MADTQAKTELKSSITKEKKGTRRQRILAIDKKYSTMKVAQIRKQLKDDFNYNKTSRMPKLAAALILEHELDQQAKDEEEEEVICDGEGDSEETEGAITDENAQDSVKA